MSYATDVEDMAYASSALSFPHFEGIDDDETMPLVSRIPPSFDVEPDFFALTKLPPPSSSGAASNNISELDMIELEAGVQMIMIQVIFNKSHFITDMPGSRSLISDHYNVLTAAADSVLAPTKNSDQLNDLTVFDEDGFSHDSDDNQLVMFNEKYNYVAAAAAAAAAPINDLYGLSLELARTYKDYHDDDDDDVQSILVPINLDILAPGKMDEFDFPVIETTTSDDSFLMENEPLQFSSVNGFQDYDNFDRRLYAVEEPSFKKPRRTRATAATTTTTTPTMKKGRAKISRRRPATPYRSPVSTEDSKSSSKPLIAVFRGDFAACLCSNGLAKIGCTGQGCELGMYRVNDVDNFAFILVHACHREECSCKGQRGHVTGSHHVVRVTPKLLQQRVKIPKPDNRRDWDRAEIKATEQAIEIFTTSLKIYGGVSTPELQAQVIGVLPTFPVECSQHQNKTKPYEVTTETVVVQLTGV